jgi:hypothetical protein
MCILGGFLNNEEFGLRGRRALRLQEQIIQVATATAPPQQSLDIAVDRLHHTHRYLDPAVVQNAFPMIH